MRNGTPGVKMLLQQEKRDVHGVMESAKTQLALAILCHAQWAGQYWALWQPSGCVWLCRLGTGWC
jgi:hypothetical protein